MEEDFAVQKGKLPKAALIAIISGAIVVVVVAISLIVYFAFLIKNPCLTTGMTRREPASTHSMKTIN